VAALVLGLGSGLTLLFQKEPWHVSLPVLAIGARISMALGLEIQGLPFWEVPVHREMINGSWWKDIKIRDTFSLVTASMVASIFAGDFRRGPESRLGCHPETAAATLIGGVLLGYGAGIGSGCNIGGYLGGVLSFSLHGWLWLFACLIGSVVGVGMRPLFGLSKDLGKTENWPR